MYTKPFDPDLSAAVYPDTMYTSASAGVAGNEDDNPVDTFAIATGILLVTPFEPVPHLRILLFRKEKFVLK